MEFKNFEPPNHDGEFFPTEAPPGDVTIYYHGSSRYFSPVIEKKGFQPDYRFASDDELAVLRKYAHRFVIAGTNYLPSLGGNKPITLAGTSIGAMRYTNPSRKGGIAKTLLDDLRALLSDPGVAADDEAILMSLKRRLEPIEHEDGVIYAIGLRGEERKRLTGCDPYHVNMIPLSGLLYAMVIPHGFKY